MDTKAVLVAEITPKSTVGIVGLDVAAMDS